MICCAEIDAQVRHFGQALHRIVVVSEQLRHLLIELTEVVFDRQQFVERQLHQPPINRMKVRHAPNCNQLRKLSSAASRFFFDGTADPHDAVRVFIGHDGELPWMRESG